MGLTQRSKKTPAGAQRAFHELYRLSAQAGPSRDGGNRELRDDAT
jgi:hypothetical protein